MSARYWKRFAETPFNAKYQLRQFLGAGSYGAVFLADEVVLDRLIRQVAIKVLLQDDPGDQKSLDRVINELTLATTLKHPHLLDCYSSEQGVIDEEPVLGLVMEVASGTLQDRLYQVEGLLPAAEVREVARQMASVLMFLHAQQPPITHRDVKPENVLRVGEVWKLADLGIARVVRSGSATFTAQQLATKSYAPPEAYKGEVRPGWDVWSLGVMVQELLTGMHPFPADTDEVRMRKVLDEEPQIPEQLAEPFRAIVLGALTKDVHERWTAQQVMQALSPTPPPDDRDPRLTPVSFTTARIERVVTQWQIKYSAASHLGYREVLGDGVDLVMMNIPAGSFSMGSPETEEHHESDESPQHPVRLSRFFLGCTAVTQAQWRMVAKYPQIARPLDPDPSRFKGLNRPVEQVSWEDAQEFCQRLSQRTGRVYRLPSEAEWEYACRAGTTTPFHYGATITPKLANYDGNYSYGRGPKGEYRQQTTDVGQFPANAWGLHDLHGNVWEWCLDDWHDNYQGAPSDGSAWLDEKRTNSSKLLRGGSWILYPRGCRSAIRYCYSRDLRHGSLGFRVLCGASRTGTP